MGNRALAVSPKRRLVATLLGALALHCGSGQASTAEGGRCFPDADGITGGSYTIHLAVADDGFSKSVLSTQNDSTVTLTLTNTGTRPHGFGLECASVTAEHPELPPGCDAKSCFPADSTIAPLEAGESATVTFVTPTPDDLIYTFRSTAPGDASVPELNAGQWSIR